jgi:hypothetical protein
MHPKGEILVSFVREGDGLQAKISLPSGVTGIFVWNGTSTPLKSGEQTLQLP